MSLSILQERLTRDFWTLSPIRANGPGARIEVNGKLVRELVDPVILAGFNLVQALANWLYKHP